MNIQSKALEFIDSLGKEGLISASRYDEALQRFDKYIAAGELSDKLMGCALKALLRYEFELLPANASQKYLEKPRRPDSEIFWQLRVMAAADCYGLRYDHVWTISESNPTHCDRYYAEKYTRIPEAACDPHIPYQSDLRTSARSFELYEQPDAAALYLMIRDHFERKLNLGKSAMPLANAFGTLLLDNHISPAECGSRYTYESHVRCAQSQKLLVEELQKAKINPFQGISIAEIGQAMMTHERAIMPLRDMPLVQAFFEYVGIGSSSYQDVQPDKLVGLNTQQHLFGDRQFDYVYTNKLLNYGSGMRKHGDENRLMYDLFCTTCNLAKLDGLVLHTDILSYIRKDILALELANLCDAELVQKNERLVNGREDIDTVGYNNYVLSFVKKSYKQITPADFQNHLSDRCNIVNQINRRMSGGSHGFDDL